MTGSSWRALGTSVHVLTTDDATLPPAAAAVAAVLEEVDLACSRFRQDSELSRLNSQAGRPVRVSPLLRNAIEVALRGARLSEGAVDPTVGHAIRLAGYDDDFSRIGESDRPAVLIAEEVPGWRAVSLDRVLGTVTVPPGVELDLGSTGKALAADIAAAAAHRAAGRGGVLVSLGGDIATAGEAPPGGWRILVAENSETAADGCGETICIRSGAVATSGTTVRRWTRAGVALHHIIDPATGLPTQGPWRTVTVAAATCVDANIAATAAIVRGADAVSWLDDRGLPSRLVSTAGDICRVGGWPALTAAA